MCNSRKYYLFFTLLLVISFQLVSGCSSGQSTPSSVSKESKEPRDFRSGGDINTIKHGEPIIISGQVIAGNGKKSSREFATSFGVYESQPILIQDKTKNELSIVLKKPLLESTYEKNIIVKGIADKKANDPGIIESYSITTSSRLKLSIVDAEIIK